MTADIIRPQSFQNLPPSRALAVHAQQADKDLARIQDHLTEMDGLMQKSLDRAGSLTDMLAELQAAGDSLTAAGATMVAALRGDGRASSQNAPSSDRASG